MFQTVVAGPIEVATCRFVAVMLGGNVGWWNGGGRVCVEGDIR